MKVYLHWTRCQTYSTEGGVSAALFNVYAAAYELMLPTILKSYVIRGAATANLVVKELQYHTYEEQYHGKEAELKSCKSSRSS